MKKVKVFEFSVGGWLGCSSSDIEQQINDFIKDVKLIDIRVTSVSGTDNLLYLYYTVIYEEKEV